MRVTLTFLYYYEAFFFFLFLHSLEAMLVSKKGHQLLRTNDDRQKRPRVIVAKIMTNTGFQNVCPLHLENVYYSKKEILSKA